MNEIYGWINLKGEFEATECYGHNRAPCVQHIWDELGYQEELDAIENICQDAADDGDHPKWHCYKMAADGYKWEVIEEAYKRGLIRVGTRGMDMHFEYGSGALVGGMLKACRHDHCKKFAASQGCAAKFENVHK